MNREEAQNERFASKCQIVQPTIDWSKIQREASESEEVILSGDLHGFVMKLAERASQRATSLPAFQNDISVAILEVYQEMLVSLSVPSTQAAYYFHKKGCKTHTVCNPHISLLQSKPII